MNTLARDHLRTIAIPTMFKAPELTALVTALCDHSEDFDCLYIMDNTTPRSVDAWPFPLFPRSDWGDKVVLVSAPQPRWSITDMWNWAWRMTKPRGLGATADLILLNDDIVIPPGRFIDRLCAPLRDDGVWVTYPDYNLPLDADGTRSGVTATEGTYKHGGLWGCAFALRAELLHNPLPQIDPQFRVWCGDDDLVYQVKAHGGLTCRVEGLALEHHASTTFGQVGVAGAAWQDVERFKLKYGPEAW